MFGYFESSISGILAPLPNGGLDGCTVFTAKLPHARATSFVAPPAHFWVSWPSKMSELVAVYSG